MTDGRVKLDANGLIIALPSHVWSDGDQYLAFNSNSVAMQIYASGAVALSVPLIDLSSEFPGIPGAFNNRYHKNQIPFGKTFAVPPICLVMADNNTDTKYWVPSFGLVGVNVSPNWSRWEPLFFAEVTTTDLFIWSIFADGFAAKLHYLVLENTLS